MTQTPDTLLELWEIVKHDSLASSKIGSPSYYTRQALTLHIQREVVKGRIDEHNKTLLEAGERVYTTNVKDPITHAHIDGFEEALFEIREKSKKRIKQLKEEQGDLDE